MGSQCVGENVGSVPAAGPTHRSAPTIARGLRACTSPLRSCTVGASTSRRGGPVCPPRVDFSTMKRYVLLALCTAAFAAAPADSQTIPADTFAGLKARSIGPAVTSGRVMTIAVDPTNHAVFYVGAASGGVWKTMNGGASFQPVF